MLVAAAVCPCPPLLVPEVAAGAAPELDAARAACDEAIGAVVAARPDLIVVVGEGGRTTFHEAGARGSFRPFGVDVDVVLGAPAGAVDVTLPPSLAVGAWLLARAGWDGAVRGYEVAGERSWPTNGEDGVHLSTMADRVGMLVMGDGTACRTVKAPGYLDERAEGVDAGIAEALRTLDHEGFLPNLSADLARELKVSGRSPWQILLGADCDDGLGARLLYEDAPYGVGYFVASWT
ncbi:class III extradiol dioxygenase subunit B-like domain-containing protein [Streptomyces sp. VRA16 Mangrove soil]|uniref:class III extradiol dioxygenase subunit B-like domain-containing protein n=1 Tax=Streptomyces sp. VRA16 Mangrove soil TaxID=2817434 RepID=UPI001A9EABAD|nr:class III extradiol dioxygenase subunit B-like domain-containing protein [Streptomyces sp. VRA16 Mangrove soil]MBO1335816.1 class III extradiol dioxygenase subunit B-like domain-containing protein [Streptomyces sp. VRA16 Mangrove soil]